jgi:hypothetical protein
MALPPTQRVPTLRRLLVPGEAIIYTAKFYPLRGWPWLLGGGLLLLASEWWPLLLAPSIALIIWWIMPFRTNQVAVTSQRLLLRLGTARLQLEAIDGKRISSWVVTQSVLEAAAHCGTVTITVDEDGSKRLIQLTWLWHPLTFVEALETLEQGWRNAAKPA